MDKTALTILCIVGLATLSCSKEEITLKNDTAIQFTSYLNKSANSKASTIYINDLQQTSIGVLAWRTRDNDISFTGIDDAGSIAPNFINNAQLIWNYESSQWQLTHDRYWPSTGEKVSFYAYAPYTNGVVPGNDSPSQPYHPENIKYTNGPGAHILELSVPYSTTPTKTDKLGYDIMNQTDFLVARKGTDYKPDNGSSNGMINDVYTGVNQNLNKEYNSAVQFIMRHALSKISFAIKAGEREIGIKYPYAKVIIDRLNINGHFSSKGKYDLYNEMWYTSNSDHIEQYTMENSYPEIDNNILNDAFNAIADEVYNITPTSTDINETADSDGYYKLNKSSHDLMVIPGYHNGTSQEQSQIESITGRYIVYTYTNEDCTGEIFDTETVDFNFTPDQPLLLEAGKAYTFRLNIELKAITFDVQIENWENGAENNWDIIYGDGSGNDSDDDSEILPDEGDTQYVTSAIIHTKDGKNSTIGLTSSSTIYFSGNTMTIKTGEKETILSLDNINKFMYQDTNNSQDYE